MSFSPFEFENLSAAERTESVNRAQDLMRAVITHRNSISKEDTPAGAQDLETFLMVRHLYRTWAHAFSETWGRLVAASPASPFISTPEEFLHALFPTDGSLLTSNEEAPEKVQVQNLGQLETMHPAISYIWPHVIQQADPKRRSLNATSLSEYTAEVPRWRYLWLPGDSTYEADWFIGQVISGKISPAAVFVETDDEGFHTPHMLYACDQPTYDAAKTEVFEQLSDDFGYEDTPEYNDAALDMLIPLPWRQWKYDLVYFNPPLIEQA